MKCSFIYSFLEFKKDKKQIYKPNCTKLGWLLVYESVLRQSKKKNMMEKSRYSLFTEGKEQITIIKKSRSAWNLGNVISALSKEFLEGHSVVEEREAKKNQVTCGSSHCGLVGYKPN